LKRVKIPQRFPGSFCPGFGPGPAETHLAQGGGIFTNSYPLPANATKAVWRSRSTPAASGYNEISFEDRAGAERFYERAGRDKATEVLRDESLQVGGKRSHGVSGDEDRAIGGTVRERIRGDLHSTVKGERRDRIDAAHSLSIGGDKQEEIGGRWAVAADGAIHLDPENLRMRRGRAGAGAGPRSTT
jgi:uncharacterized protein involved in type VI secretion and phage assembly